MTSRDSSRAACSSTLLPDSFLHVLPFVSKGARAFRFGIPIADYKPTCATPAEQTACRIQLRQRHYDEREENHVAE